MPTIAVIGANSNRSKYANACVRSHLAEGWTVFPVHPSETQVEGLTVYRSLAEIPVEKLDRVSVYIPKDAALKFLDTVQPERIGEIWLNPGADDPEVVEKAKSLGLDVIQACSIVRLGRSPHEFME